VSESLPPVVANEVTVAAASSRWTGRIALAIVLTAACALSALTYRQFLSDHRSLWYSTDHDRNAHYLYALKLASALRGWDFVEFLHEINRAYVWPPLHGLMAALILAFEGFDYRLAVLPSLIGWAGTAVLAFLLARRSVPQWGELAGLVAATLVLASPLHRGFATDVMLESMGACLTLLTLFLYVRTVQEGKLSHYRWLVLCLTIIFLHKYNYWLLTVLAIVGAELIVRGAFYARIAKGFLSQVNWHASFRREMRQPLSWLAMLGAAVVLGLLASGIRSIEVAGRTIRTHPPTALVNIAYLAALLRLLWWSWTNRGFIRGWDPRLRTIVSWHLLPVALFLALPRHLATFLWYLSPSQGATERTSLWNGIRYYAPAAVEHYHVGAWSAIVVASLFLAALAAWRRLRPGAIAVLLLVVISALLTSLHGNRQIRFLHTWFPAFWVCAGIGAVTAASLLVRRMGARLSGAFIALTALVLVALHAPPIFMGKRSPIGGPCVARASMLEVSDAIRRETANTERFTIFTTVPFRFFSEWVFLEHQDAGSKFESHWWGYGQPERANRDGFQSWLETACCDTVVFVDGTPPDMSGLNVEVQRHIELREQILGQKTFQLVSEQGFPAQGCRLLVYRRVERRRAGAEGSSVLASGKR
jgi:hypothetical protein